MAIDTVVASGGTGGIVALIAAFIRNWEIKKRFNGDSDTNNIAATLTTISENLSRMVANEEKEGLVLQSMNEHLTVLVDRGR